MRLFKIYSKTLVRPVRPVRLTSFVDVPRFFGRKSLRPTFPVILAQWQTPSQKALASVTALVMRTAKKSKHKQTNKKHRKETQNKIKNGNSLCISCFGFIYAKREKCERLTKASQKVVEASIFFLALASPVSRLVKRNGKESNPTDIKTTTTMLFNTVHFVHFPTFTALL